MAKFSGDHEWDTARQLGRTDLPNVWRPPDYDPTQGHSGGDWSTPAPPIITTGGSATPAAGAGGYGSGGSYGRGSSASLADILVAVGVIGTAYVGFSTLGLFLIPVWGLAYYVTCKLFTRLNYFWTLYASIAMMVLMVVGIGYAVHLNKKESVTSSAGVTNERPTGTATTGPESPSEKNASNRAWLDGLLKKKAEADNIQPVPTTPPPQAIPEPGTPSPADNPPDPKTAEAIPSPSPIPPAAASVLSPIDVTHNHSLSEGCNGVLSLITERLRYESSNEKDSFDVPLSEIKVEKAEKTKLTLRVLSRNKKYNFIFPAGEAAALLEHDLLLVH